MAVERLRYLAGWPLAIALAFLSLGSRADGELERLASFPQSRLAIATPDARIHTFRVWVATTPAQRAQGLMWIRDLPDGTGMLFVHGRSGPVSMWMKNTLIPLDMLFIRENGRIAGIVENTEPLSLATIESQEDVLAVLELEGGTAQRLGLRAGAIVQHPVFGTAASAP